MTKVLTLIVAISLFAIYSCDSNNLDLSGNWIKVNYDNENIKEEIADLENDTIFTENNVDFSVLIHTQIQPNFDLKMFKENIDTELIDITNDLVRRGYYEEDGVQRKIDELKVYVNDYYFNSANELKYLIRLQSPSEMFEKKLIIRIK